MQVTKQVARGFGDDVMQGIPIRSLGGTVAVQIESWLKDFTNDRVCHRFSLIDNQFNGGVVMGEKSRYTSTSLRQVTCQARVGSGRRLSSGLPSPSQPAHSGTVNKAHSARDPHQLLPNDRRSRS